jgi:hypothetical protein
MEQGGYSAAGLEALRPWVARQIRRLRVERDRLLAAAEPPPGPEETLVAGGAYAGPERARATVRLALTLEAVEERGFIVRDLDGGLVDAPLRSGGRICWLVDEREIRRWHRAASRREPPAQ